MRPDFNHQRIYSDFAYDIIPRNYPEQAMILSKKQPEILPSLLEFFYIQLLWILNMILLKKLSKKAKIFNQRICHRMLIRLNTLVKSSVASYAALRTASGQHRGWQAESLYQDSNWDATKKFPGRQDFTQIQSIKKQTKILTNDYLKFYPSMLFMKLPNKLSKNRLRF